MCLQGLLRPVAIHPHSTVTADDDGQLFSIHNTEQRQWSLSTCASLESRVGSELEFFIVKVRRNDCAEEALPDVKKDRKLTLEQLIIS